MLKIASSEIAAPDLAPEGGGGAEAVPARLQAHAVADEAEWHRSDDVRLCATDQLIKAAHYRVSAKDIRQRCRRAPITRARRNAFLLCRELTGRSFPEIGRRLGDFDHTMVLHGFFKILAHQSYPVIDESSGDSLRGMIEAADRLLSMIDADTVVVPGHGAVTDRGGLIAFHNMLRSIEDKILAMIEARRGLPEIIAARPTAEFDPLWGRGYVTGARFTRMVLAGDETLHNAGSHDMVRIRAFSGSSRRDSLNQRLLDQAALGAHAAGAEVTSIRLSDFELPIDDADWEAEHGLPNSAEALKALLAGHQGLLIHQSTMAAIRRCSRTRWTGMSRPSGFAAGKVLPVVPEPMSVPRAPVFYLPKGAACGSPRRSSPLRAAPTCSSCGRSLRAPASITNQRSIPCH